MSKANEIQVAGTHYHSKYQHWDWVQSLNVPYLPAQVVKYLVRWRKKNGVQDLEKAKHFLDKFIEEETIRRADALTMTSNFIRENEVPGEEGVIIRTIIDQIATNAGFLEQASAILGQMILRELKNVLVKQE